ncbi:MAG: hypothetical protein VW258_03440 [Thalassolituus sp.]
MKRITKNLIRSSVVPAFCAMAFLSAPVMANQYIGFGIEYGMLSHESSGTDYDLLNLQTRFGYDFSDRFTIEIEGNALGKDNREFSQECLDQETVDSLSSDDVTVGCAFLDDVSRQSAQVNFIFSQPFANFDLFAAVGIGAVRTRYSFEVDSIEVSNSDGGTSYDASDITSTQNQVNLLLGFFGIDPIDLQVPGNINETSIDMMYALQAGALIDNQHRIAVSWNPEYGNNDIGKYSYVGVSYSWLFRFSDY